MRRTTVLIIMLALSLFAVTTTASAQGYGVYEQGACAAGRGGATVASPCPDASSIFFNPAGIVMTPGTIFTGGATVIGPRGSFTDSTTGQVSNLNNRYYPVPNVYFKGNFAKGRLSAGVGLFAPYGLTTDWPPDASQGRFLGYKSVVESVYIQPTFAVKLNDMLAVGGGVAFAYTHLELRQRLDLSTVAIPGTGLTFGTLPVGAVPPGTDFADVDLGATIAQSSTGNAWSVGYHLGVIAKPTNKVSVGARFLSGQTAKVEDALVNYTQIKTGLVLQIPLGPTIPKGTPIDAIVAPNFAAGGKLSAQNANASLPLPMQVVAGVAVQATPKLLVEGDYQYGHWSSFDALTINQTIAGTTTIIENFGNTSGVRFGVDYALNPTTSIRGGANFHAAAAPPETVTPNLPEAARQEFMVGFGKSFGKARIDAYYMYLHQSNRAGRTNGPASGVAPTTQLNNGTYTFMSNLFGVSFSVGFGAPAPAK